MDARQRHCAPSRRQRNNISLATNFEARYWMQALGVTRYRLEEVVAAVGSRVELVMDYLSVPERRVVNELLSPSLSRARVLDTCVSAMALPLHLDL